MLGKKIQKKEILQLQKQNERLRKLTEITKTINASLDLGKLLNAIMKSVKDILNCEASSLLFYDEDTGELVFKVAIGEASSKLSEKHRIKKDEGIAGWVAKTCKPIIVNDVYSDSRFNPRFDQVTGFKTKSIICAPLLFKGKLVGVVQGINPLKNKDFSKEDMETFLTFADQAVMAVQNAMLFDRAVDEERIKQELSSASDFQKKQLQEFQKSFNNFNIAARSITAHEVGGEFYDFFNFDNNSFAITLGDIHEKGIPGAISASMISGAIKMLSQKNNTPPIAFVKKLGDFIHNNIQSFKEVSFFYSLLNIENKTLEFANTGFAYPILVRNNISRYLRFNTHSFRSDKDFENVKYPKKVRVHLQPGDVFVIVTDGILNLRNKQSQRFGLKRVMKIAQTAKGTPEEMIQNLISESDSFIEGLEKREDLTIICFHVH